MPWKSISGSRQTEGLGHPDQRVVDGQVPMGVELGHGLARDLGAFHVRPVGPVVLDVHRVEDPAVDRLQAVTGVREGLWTMTDMAYSRKERSISTFISMGWTPVSVPVAAVAAVDAHPGRMYVRHLDIQEP